MELEVVDMMVLGCDCWIGCGVRGCVLVKSTGLLLSRDVWIGIVEATVKITDINQHRKTHFFNKETPNRHHHFAPDQNGTPKRWIYLKSLHSAVVIIPLLV